MSCQFPKGHVCIISSIYIAFSHKKYAINEICGKQARSLLNFEKLKRKKKESERDKKEIRKKRKKKMGRKEAKEEIMKKERWKKGRRVGRRKFLL